MSQTTLKPRTATDGVPSSPCLRPYRGRAIPAHLQPAGLKTKDLLALFFVPVVTRFYFQFAFGGDTPISEPFADQVCRRTCIGSCFVNLCAEGQRPGPNPGQDNTGTNPGNELG